MTNEKLKRALKSTINKSHTPPAEVYQTLVELLSSLIIQYAEDLDLDVCGNGLQSLANVLNAATETMNEIEKELN